MNTMHRRKSSRQNAPEIPPIIVIDARNLPRRERRAASGDSEEQIVVIFPKPTVSHAFRNFRGSTAMLFKTLVRCVLKYFARINRGHIHRQRDI